MQFINGRENCRQLNIFVSMFLMCMCEYMEGCVSAVNEIMKNQKQKLKLFIEKAKKKFAVHVDIFEWIKQKIVKSHSHHTHT